MYSVIGIYIALGLLALAVIAILISGIRGLINGEQELKKILTYLFPFVVYAVAYAVSGEFVTAGIFTLVVLLALMVLAIILTGLRTTFNF